MSIPIKKQETIISEIIDNIKIDSDKGIAVYENSPPYDVFIKPLSDIEYDTEIFADFVHRSSSYFELEQIVRDGAYQDKLRFALNLTFPQVQTLISRTIDNLASNDNTTRKPAQKSRGYIRLFFATSSAVTFSSVITISTLNGIQFQTKNTFSNFTPFYDPIEGLYYIDSAIEALVAGQDSNVEIGTILNIVSGVSDLKKVINFERTKFGKNQETDLELLARAVFSGDRSKRVMVLGGFVEKLLNYPGVVDVSVIMPSDTESVRNEKNGVDIYLLAEEKLQLKEDIFNTTSARYAWERIENELTFETYPITYDSTGITYFKFLNQPVIDIASVSYSTTPTGSFTTIGASSYAMFSDTTGTFAGSVRAHDYFSVNNSALPNNSYLKVSYNYDRLYVDLQSLFASYETDLIGADLLFKKATEKAVNITLSPTIFISPSSLVTDNIVQDLRVFFEGGIASTDIEYLPFKLGQRLDKSDMIKVVLSINGVDRLNELNNSNDLLIATIDNVEIDSFITPKLSEYFRLGTVTFSSKTPKSIVPITRE